MVSGQVTTVHGVVQEVYPSLKENLREQLILPLHRPFALHDKIPLLTLENPSLHFKYTRSLYLYFFFVFRGLVAESGILGGSHLDDSTARKTSKRFEIVGNYRFGS